MAFSVSTTLDPSKQVYDIFHSYHNPQKTGHTCKLEEMRFLLPHTHQTHSLFLSPELTDLFSVAKAILVEVLGPSLPHGPCPIGS